MNKVLTEIWDFFKKNFAILVVLFVFFTWWTGCGKSVDAPKNTSDTVVTQVPQPIVIMPPYQPQQQGNTIYVPTPTGYQPITPDSTIQGLIAQVLELSKSREDLAKQYFAIKNYSDSIQLKDTAGNRVGVVNLNQTVSENTLTSTQPTYQLNFPKTVITNTIYPKAKNQVYVGISTQSLINTPKIQQASLDFLLKNKKDNIISISGYYDLPLNQPGIRVGFLKKLSFKL